MPGVYVDISDVAERKVKAIDQLKSQNYAGPLARKTVECFDGVQGAPGGVPDAECFIRLHSETYRYLPVPGFARE